MSPGRRFPHPWDELPWFTTLADAVARAGGLDLRAYKESAVVRRVRARAKALGEADAEAYARRVAHDPAEARRFARSLSVAVSGFFRDPAVFQALGRLLPELAARREGPRGLRLWSVGCSKGQEAYSLAATMLQARPEPPPFRVLGTDRDERALARAREGVYGDRDVEGLPTDLRARVLERAGAGRWRVRAEVRERVEFRTADLLDPASYPERVDLIACRNVLIYLRRPVQVWVLEHLASALAPGGALVLGTSETLLGLRPELFVPWDARLRIYRKRG